MVAIDPIARLIDAKREARKGMLAGQRRSKTRREKAQWQRWIDKGDKEITALISAQEQILGLQAVKRARTEAEAAHALRGHSVGQRRPAARAQR